MRFFYLHVDRPFPHHPCPSGAHNPSFLQADALMAILPKAVRYLTLCKKANAMIYFVFRLALNVLRGSPFLPPTLKTLGFPFPPFL